jgi:hypothetical protein
MATRLTDLEIQNFLGERKDLPPDYLQRLRTKPKSGHEERELDLKGISGSDFRVILRKSMYNSFDFSVILAYCVPGTTQVFRLRRYNGKSHEHTNAIERETFYAFHIHTATERYQDLGMREDSFAEPSDRFSNFDEAVDCLFDDANFKAPEGQQGRLFKEE